MYNYIEMVKIAKVMSGLFDEGCFLGDFARGVLDNPNEYTDDRSQDILLTFSETRIALGYND